MLHLLGLFLLFLTQVVQGQLRCITCQSYYYDSDNNYYNRDILHVTNLTNCALRATNGMGVEANLRTCAVGDSVCYIYAQVQSQTSGNGGRTILIRRGCGLVSCQDAGANGLECESGTTTAVDANGNRYASPYSSLSYNSVYNNQSRYYGNPDPQFGVPYTGIRYCTGTACNWGLIGNLFNFPGYIILGSGSATITSTVAVSLLLPLTMLML